MASIPPFIAQHIRNQKQVVAQRKLAQRKIKNMAYNIPQYPPRNRRDVFGSMSNVQYETVALDGRQYTLWYENNAQRMQLMDEIRRKKFGVMSEVAVDDFKENIFGMR